MKNILLFLCFILLTSIEVIGQNTTTPDSLYNEIIQKYKAELEEINDDDRAKSDSLGALRALEFEELYNMYPESKSAKKGLLLAFRSWLNVDSVATMGKYVNTVSYNEDFWHELMTWYGYGLSNSGVDPFKYYEGLQTILESETVLNPYSLTFLYSELGKFEMMITKNRDKAIGYFENVIEIGVDSIEVEMAKRDIYDLKALKIGEQVPSFKVKDLNGNTIDIEDYRGKFVMIEFWATWCGPCIPEIPYLKDAYEKYGDRDDFEMIGVSLDTSRENLVQFLEENGIDWTQILDTNGESKWTRELGRLFAVGNGIPKTFLINEKGIIVATELRKEKINDILASYLD